MRKRKIFLWVGLSLLFLYGCAYMWYYLDSRKEKRERMELACQITYNRDDKTEKYFQDIRKEILADTFLCSQKPSLFSPDKREQREEEMEHYIRAKYFPSYFSTYDFLFTFCDSLVNLELSESTFFNCQSYFTSKIADLADTTSCPALYKMNYGIEYLSYLMQADFPFYTLYIELGSQSMLREESYLDMLSFANTPVLSIDPAYSYALYKEGDLLLHEGEFLYSLKTPWIEQKGEYRFADWDNYSHLLSFVEDGQILIISVAHPSSLSVLHLFSQMLLAVSIVVGLICLILAARSSLRLGFAQKLQITILSLSFSILVILCALSIYYIRTWNEEKNANFLREKTLSTLLYMERRYMDTPAPHPNCLLSDSLCLSWQKDIKRLSRLLVCNIHIFDAQGTLIMTTQPRVFEQGLLSDTINKKALMALQNKNTNLFIQKEKIHDESYLSAYVPFRNARNEVFGYVNLPYFVNETQWQKQVGSYISSYITLYVFLAILVVLIAFIISNHLIRPLRRMTQHFSQIELGRKNTHLEWKKKDEIGELITQYNALIDELENSADLLAQSERQNAWTQMAKQVAHEIKNPLTPIKLQVQQLQRAYMDQKPDFSQRLQRFTDLLIEQIDRLSDIATTFSQYAQWSNPQIQSIDIRLCIEKTLSLFEDRENIKFTLQIQDVAKKAQADEKQFMQVLLNIYKNAVQAVEQKQQCNVNLKGEVDTSVFLEGEFVCIKISDNGVGIPAEFQARLFEPNFTTKSNGSGLGLAISKRIMNGMKGEISLHSQKDAGVELYLKLKRDSNEN